MRCCNFREGQPIEIVPYDLIPVGSDGAAIIYTIASKLYLKVPITGTNESVFVYVDFEHVRPISASEYEGRRNTIGPLVKSNTTDEQESFTL